MLQITPILPSPTLFESAETLSTFEEAYVRATETFACTTESIVDLEKHDQAIIACVIAQAKELVELRRDEEIMGRTADVQDGYAWVTGFLAGVLAEYASARKSSGFRMGPGEIVRKKL